MEILVITWNYSPRQGGMEQLLASVCGGLSENHRVFVLTAYAEKSVTAAAEIMFRPASPGLLRFFLFAFSKGLTLLRGNSGIQIVFGGSVLVTPMVLALARFFKRTSVVQAHGLDLVYRSPVYQFFIVRWLRYVDRVVANSRHSAALARAKGVAESKITVIPPGVDCRRFETVEPASALKQRLGLDGGKVILFVGRLARRKGVKEFVEHCLPRIVDAVPQACFAIVGDNPSESLAHHGDAAGAIRETVTRVNLSDHVRWFGAVGDEELINLYALCDVLVLPARELVGDVEGFGMVALEAAAAGKPVVATRIGGIPDAVADGAGGILIGADDYRGLSQAVVSLLKNAEQAAAMGDAGRRRALEKFDWSVIVARYEAELSRIAVVRQRENS